MGALVAGIRGPERRDVSEDSVVGGDLGRNGLVQPQARRLFATAPHLVQPSLRSVDGERRLRSTEKRAGELLSQAIGAHPVVRGGDAADLGRPEAELAVAPGTDAGLGM